MHNPNKKYSSLGEADNKLIDLRTEHISKVCPIFKGLCEGGHCHSYYAGTITKDLKVIQPFCSCSLVTGQVEHYYSE